MLIEVAVPLPVHGRFTWSSERALPVGTSVVVPYGSRELTGWVVGPGEAPPGVEVKPIRGVVREEAAFTEDQLGLYRWMAEYYLSPLGEVIATATPAATGASTRRIYRPTEEGVERLAVAPPPGERGSVLREVVSRPGASRAALERRLHEEVAEVGPHLTALVQAGLVAGEDVVQEGVRDEELWVIATGEGEARSAKGQEVLERLPARLRDLPAGVVAALVRVGAARKEHRARMHVSDRSRPPSVPPPLNAAQSAAVAAVNAAGVYLLHGVTGAGKTEVYLALAEQVLARGKQVLVLVPEIALTPLLCSRFEARFPGQVAVLHSALAAGEKLGEWRRIRAGEASVVVGARSAVFAPFSALGLVIVDEEHDDSFKQDEGVRYHGRDLAVVRATRARCPCVLGSATPSLESWRNAELGRYKLLQLLERATPRPVPSLELVDMRPVARAAGGKAPLLAPIVDEAVREALAAGGKAILLYNRRGYATFVECPGCGASQECPSCGIPLVYHQKVGRLDCHTCGFHRRFQPNCGVCGSEVEVLGRGTERVEEAVAEAFPGVPVGRMDADTTTERGAHARILDDFREGRTQLLVGTQVIAKGHDFPDVHVAAVLGVDHVLGMPDFRAAERTFALVTQLIGRAGRGTVAGKVFLQTRHPDHPVFACVNDMAAFAGQEGRIRRTLGYPPYTRLVLVRLEGVDRTAALAAASEIARLARARAPEFAGVDVLGPTPAPLPRAVGRWRFQVFFRGRTLATFRSFLKAVQPEWRTAPGVRRIVDVDPRGLA